jgi:hypothetical protein
MNIADQLEKHAGQELQHALTIAPNRLSWKDTDGFSRAGKDLRRSEANTPL